MALTRKMLKAMGIEEEKVDQIVEAHSETVEALKEERDQFKADSEKLAGVQKKLDEATEKLAKQGKEGETVPKSKFDELKTEFDTYKADIASKEQRTAKETAYRELLKAAGVSEKRIATVMKVSNIDEIELDESGKVKDADKQTETIKTEWADFIESSEEKGADFSKHPSGKTDPADLGKLSMAEYIEARKKQK